MSAGTIILDVTRLIGRSRLAAPTGIDRVEFAYAKTLREEFGPRLGFGVRSLGDLIIMNGQRLDRFLDLTEAQWTTHGSRETADDLRLLQGFLGLPAEIAAADDRAKASLEGKRPRRAAGIALESLGRHLVNRFGGTKTIERGSVYMNVSHAGLGLGGACERIIKRHDLKSVFFLHDLIPITHPEFGRAGEYERHEARLATMIGTGRILIANSHYTAGEARRFAKARGLDLPETLVAHLGTEDVWTKADPGPPLKASCAYFVYIGTIEPRKNHLLLLNLWRRLVETLGPSAPKLLLIGRRGWENENVVDMLDRCAVIEDHVFETGRLNDAALLRILRRARALLFPSFVEGYGLPLAEALAMGVPAIASDIEVFREIGQGVPELLDPLDGIGWLQKIIDYAAPNSPTRNAQLAKITSYKAPSWDDHFRVISGRLAQLSESASAPPAVS